MAGSGAGNPPNLTPPSTPSTPASLVPPTVTAPIPTPATTSAPAAIPAVANPTVPPVGPRYGQGLLKLLIALILSGLTYYCVTIRKERFAQAQPAASQEQTSSSCKSEAPQTLDVEKAVPEMKAGNELLINWSVAVLGATIGIAILAKGAKIKDKNWGLVLFPSVWVFLLASTNEGYDFKRSLTYQTAKQALSLSDLNLPLYLQWVFFRSSLIVLGFVGLWYLFFRFSMAEEKGKEGD